MIPIHYVHILDEQIWYYQFRSIQHIELLSGLVLSLYGFTFFYFRNRSIQVLSLLGTTLLCVLPFIKPSFSILFPGNYTDNWDKKVCKQTTPSSCGPASVATILYHYGKKVSEEEVAKQCYTYSGGTESWYLARYVHSLGFKTEFKQLKHVHETVKAPSLIGVKLGFYGHFIPVIPLEGNKLLIGDPLVGQRIFSRSEFKEQYIFTGWCLEVLSK